MTPIRDYVRSCRKCGVPFSGYRCKPCFNAYSKKRADPQKQRAYYKEYYAKNAAKVGAAVAARRAANPEATKAMRAAYYQANKTASNARTKKTQQSNPARSRAYTLKWIAANPGVLRTYRHNRALREKVAGKLSTGLVGRLLKLQNGRCACCGLTLGDAYHLDHIVPLKLGGNNDDKNMQLLRAKCNMQKGAKHPVEFMQSKGLLL